MKYLQTDTMDTSAPRAGAGFTLDARDVMACLIATDPTSLAASRTLKEVPWRSILLERKLADSLNALGVPPIVPVPDPGALAAAVCRSNVGDRASVGEFPQFWRRFRSLQVPQAALSSLSPGWLRCFPPALVAALLANGDECTTAAATTAALRLYAAAGLGDAAMVFSVCAAHAGLLFDVGGLASLVDSLGACGRHAAAESFVAALPAALRLGPPPLPEAPPDAVFGTPALALARALATVGAAGRTRAVAARAAGDAAESVLKWPHTARALLSAACDAAVISALVEAGNSVAAAAIFIRLAEQATANDRGDARSSDNLSVGSYISVALAALIGGPAVLYCQLQQQLAPVSLSAQYSDAGRHGCHRLCLDSARQHAVRCATIAFRALVDGDVSFARACNALRRQVDQEIDVSSALVSSLSCDAVLDASFPSMALLRSAERDAGPPSADAAGSIADTRRPSLPKIAPLDEMLEACARNPLALQSQTWTAASVLRASSSGDAWDPIPGVAASVLALRRSHALAAAPLHYSALASAFARAASARGAEAAAATLAARCSLQQPPRGPSEAVPLWQLERSAVDAAMAAIAAEVEVAAIPPRRLTRNSRPMDTTMSQAIVDAALRLLSLLDAANVAPAAATVAAALRIAGRHATHAPLAALIRLAVTHPQTACNSDVLTAALASVATRPTVAQGEPAWSVAEMFRDVFTNDVRTVSRDAVQLLQPLQPSSATFGVMLAAMRRDGNVSDAERAASRMVGAGITTTTAMWAAILAPVPIVLLPAHAVAAIASDSDTDNHEAEVRAIARIYETLLSDGDTYECAAVGPAVPAALVSLLCLAGSLADALRVLARARFTTAYDASAAFRAAIVVASRAPPSASTFAAAVWADTAAHGEGVDMPHDGVSVGGARPSSRHDHLFDDGGGALRRRKNGLAFSLLRAMLSNPQILTLHNAPSHVGNIVGGEVHTPSIVDDNIIASCAAVISSPATTDNEAAVAFRVALAVSRSSSRLWSGTCSSLRSTAGAVSWLVAADIVGAAHSAWINRAADHEGHAVASAARAAFVLCTSLLSAAPPLQSQRPTVADTISALAAAHLPVPASTLAALLRAASMSPLTASMSERIVYDACVASIRALTTTGATNDEGCAYASALAAHPAIVGVRLHNAATEVAGDVVLGIWRAYRTRITSNGNACPSIELCNAFIRAIAACIRPASDATRISGRWVDPHSLARFLAPIVQIDSVRRAVEWGDVCGEGALRISPCFLGSADGLLVVRSVLRDIGTALSLPPDIHTLAAVATAYAKAGLGSDARLLLRIATVPASFGTEYTHELAAAEIIADAQRLARVRLFGAKAAAINTASRVDASVRDEVERTSAAAVPLSATDVSLLKLGISPDGVAFGGFVEPPPWTWAQPHAVPSASAHPILFSSSDIDEAGLCALLSAMAVANCTSAELVALLSAASEADTRATLKAGDAGAARPRLLGRAAASCAYGALVSVGAVSEADELLADTRFDWDGGEDLDSGLGRCNAAAAVAAFRIVALCEAGNPLPALRLLEAHVANARASRRHVQLAPQPQSLLPLHPAAFTALLEAAAEIPQDVLVMEPSPDAPHSAAAVPYARSAALLAQGSDGTRVAAAASMSDFDELEHDDQPRASSRLRWDLPEQATQIIFSN